LSMKTNRVNITIRGRSGVLIKAQTLTTPKLQKGQKSSVTIIRMATIRLWDRMGALFEHMILITMISTVTISLEAINRELPTTQ
jgi:hypothetical protein